MNTIFSEAKAHKELILSFRRAIHQNPELSFQEYETSKFIQDRLAEMGIPFVVMAKTGVVALVGKGDRCVALRADIDALPITEETGLPYASRRAGVMHACGHDAHTAMLLGAAKILKERSDRDGAESLGGTIKLIFQPGEEMDPGGASLMIEAGALENPRPEVIFGQHVDPEGASGTVGFVSGAMMASTDELHWTIHGRGGHAAQPHLATDPVYMAACLIAQLQSLVSRSLNPLASGVLSISYIRGGTATNIIPDTVEMGGTLRAMNPEWRRWAIQTITEHSRLLCSSPLFKDGRCEILHKEGYPSLTNNPETTAFVRATAERAIGKNAVRDFEPKMWGEDFAFYTHRIPGTFWTLGVRPPERETMPGLHNARFAPDEEALPTGAALLAAAAIERLRPGHMS